MPNSLKPYTIIPSELYVKRDADRQLENILEDMGRPGYVLVSRQMGKTNLLLNAKREFEGPEDIFVYLDLSNTFDSISDCFDNIINNITDIYDEQFKGLSNKIQKLRKESSDVPAHVKHTKELRLILNSIKGKLVIILDEIDALTKTDYSDRVFSQIRSIYFSRLNFPELSRLTYVLSGVVEPKEIIKDPKISPFNIGQKIFLNDFSYEEFFNFLNQANLIIPESVAQHVYNSAGGNPRITWDICAEIESIISHKEIQSIDVDDIIQNLYLTSYDRPPVDNIRELVKNDAEIRNAVIQIYYDKGDSLNDRLRNKLYLAGITNYSNKNIEIKNSIIKKSLSLEWMQSVEEDKKGLIKVASDYYEDNNYEETLKIFNRYLKDAEFPDGTLSLCYYKMGHSALMIGSYDESLEYFSNTDFTVEDNALLFYQVLNFKGLLNFYKKEYRDSLECFKSVLNRNVKDEIFATALINFGSLSLQFDCADQLEEAKTIFNEVIDETGIDRSKISDSLLNELKCISYFNLGHLIDNNIEEQKKLYIQAISCAPGNYQAHFIVTLLSIETDSKTREQYLDKLYKNIISGDVNPEDRSVDGSIAFGKEPFFKFLIFLYDYDWDKFCTIITTTKPFLKTSQLGDIIYDLAVFGLYHLSKSDIPVQMLFKIYNNYEDSKIETNEEAYFNSVRMLSYLLPVPKQDKDFSEVYFSKFPSQKTESTDYIDIEIFGKYISYYYKSEEYSTALQYIKTIKNVRDKISPQYSLNYLLIYNLELAINVELSNKKRSIDLAQKIIHLCSNNSFLRHSKDSISRDNVKIIMSNAKNVINDYKVVKTKYARNEKVTVEYNDGFSITDKYKRLSDDLKNGRCKII